MNNLKISKTVEINNLIQKKKENLEKVYDLATGDIFMDVNQLIIKASLKTIKSGHFHYTSVYGLDDLRTAFADWMSKNYNSGFTTDNTLVTCGGKSALNLLCQSLIRKGDEVIITSPAWGSYQNIVNLYSGKIVTLEGSKENCWKISAVDLKKILSSKSKLLILNNATNPTGALYSRNELKAILKLARENQIFVISDEVYSGLVYDNCKYISCSSFQEEKANIAIVHSMSKVFALTGLRVGFIMTNPQLLKKIAALQSQNTTCAPNIGQLIAIEVFKKAKVISEEIRLAMEKRRDYLVAQIESIFKVKLIKPSSALYLFIPLTVFTKKTQDSSVFCCQILRDLNIAFVPGSAFGKEGYIRASFGGNIFEMKKALNLLNKYLNNL